MTAPRGLSGSRKGLMNTAVNNIWIYWTWRQRFHMWNTAQCSHPKGRHDRLTKVRDMNAPTVVYLALLRWIYYWWHGINGIMAKWARYKLQRKVRRGSKLYKQFPSYVTRMERLASLAQRPWKSDYENLIHKIEIVRWEARQRGDYTMSDSLRDVLQNSGVVVHDKSPK